MSETDEVRPRRSAQTGAQERWTPQSGANGAMAGGM